MNEPAAATPLLHELLDAQPRHLIRRAYRLAWSALKAETRADDVTPMQYPALTAITESPGIDTVNIAELVHIDRATIGSVLGRLGARGLIAFAPHATNGRAKPIALTEAGRRLLDASQGVRAPIAERILGRLAPDDRALLLGLQWRLLAPESATEKVPRPRSRRYARARRGDLEHREGGPVRRPPTGA